YRKRRFRDLSLHTKLVLTITASLLIGGSILVFAFEYTNPGTLGELPMHGKVLASMFQSTTTRTAGFNTIDQGALTLPSKILSMILMFIGGSSGSTAGGIKTVTFGVLMLTAFAVMRGKNDVTAFSRRIATRAILNALALAMTAGVLILVCVLVMSPMQSQPLVDVMYEAVSAFGTVGVSANLTTELVPLSRMIIIALMFFGRVGILTISLGLLMKGSKKSKIRYPEDRVLIG
ncbi:MAG: potassium transporter TrkG, partial [Clostridia bacterium]